MTPPDKATHFRRDPDRGEEAFRPGPQPMRSGQSPRNPLLRYDETHDLESFRRHDDEPRNAAQDAFLSEELPHLPSRA